MYNPHFYGESSYIPSLYNHEDEFYMYIFKIKRCPKLRSHDWTDCPYLHKGEKARRRDPRIYRYAAIVCQHFRKGNCRNGDGCSLSHGVFEYWLHPLRYRTCLCKDGIGCERKVCFFAHSLSQLRPSASQNCYCQFLLCQYLQQQAVFPSSASTSYEVVPPPPPPQEALCLPDPVVEDAFPPQEALCFRDPYDVPVKWEDVSVDWQDVVKNFGVMKISDAGAESSKKKEVSAGKQPVVDCGYDLPEIDWGMIA